MENTEFAKPFDIDGFFKSVIKKEPNLRRIPEYDAVGEFEGIQAVMKIHPVLYLYTEAEGTPSFPGSKCGVTGDIR